MKGAGFWSLNRVLGASCFCGTNYKHSTSNLGDNGVGSGTQKNLTVLLTI